MERRHPHRNEMPTVMGVANLIETAGLRITRTHGEISGIRRESALRRALEHACIVASVCDNYRGQDTVVLDVTHVTSLFDYFVITTGTNRRQLRAIAETADDALELRGSHRYGREGSDAPWICHDYGDVVLHVFTEEARKQYDLENLWGDALKVDWEAVLREIPAETVG